MDYLTHAVTKAMSAVVLSVTLSSCAGLGVVSGQQDPSRASQLAVDQGGANFESNTILKEITPQLLESESDARSKRGVADISPLFGSAGHYVIEAGDVLSIVVWEHPELTGAVGTSAEIPEAPSNNHSSSGFTVSPEGKVQFPYAGEFNVSGLTEEAARNLLAVKLARFINKPKVTLRVQSYRSKRIYVDGEVKQPGVYTITDVPMNLVEALNRAGGMLSSADQSRINVNRAGTSFLINLPELVQRGVNPGNIVLKNGDVLRVRSRDESKVFISGEVITPRALLMRDGRLSLNEALGESGGINPVSGDPSQVFVVRRGSGRPTVYKLNAESPGARAMAEAFELEPKDMIYVAATPLTNWHRTISQILPGALSSAVSAFTAVGPAR